MKRYRSLLLSILLLALGGLLLWLAFRHVDFPLMWAQIREAKLGWVALTVLATLGTYLIRTWRWTLLLKAAGQPGPYRWAFPSLMMGYLVNLAVPRLGEVTRSAVLGERSKGSLPATLGTVATERVVDVLTLLLLLITVLTAQRSRLYGFGEEYVTGPLGRFTAAYGVLAWVLIGVVMLGFLFLFLWLWRRLRQKDGLAAQFVQGLGSLFALRQWPLFLLLTLGIWTGYFLTSYLPLYALEATSHLGLATAFSLMALGSIARSLPIQGGSMGAYHAVVVEVVALYGIAGTEGMALAVLIHAIQTLFQLFVGGLALVDVSLARRRNPRAA